MLECVFACASTTLHPLHPQFASACVVQSTPFAVFAFFACASASSHRSRVWDTQGMTHGDPHLRRGAGASSAAWLAAPLGVCTANFWQGARTISKIRAWVGQRLGEHSRDERARVETPPADETKTRFFGSARSQVHIPLFATHGIS